MDVAQIVQVLLSECPPVEASSLTAESKERIAQASSLKEDDPALPGLYLLRWAARFGAREVHFQAEQRQVVWSIPAAHFPEEFWFDPELMEWWWMVLGADRQGWLALVRKGEVRLLSWDGKRVSSSQGHAPRDIPDTLELRLTLKELETPILSAFADKKILDGLRSGFAERARVYPLLIYFNKVLWEWPLDINLERPCSFSYYDLLPAGAGELGFAVAHPWGHGCRYWLTGEGKIVDMVARGAGDTQENTGNICYVPALEQSLQPERRLNLLRKRGEPCVELSPPRAFWGRNSYLPGHAELLLDPRTLIFGANPVIRLQQRPMRARRLFLQTEQSHETNTVIPIRHGLVLDPVFVPGKPGGMYLLAACPEELEVARHGRRLADLEVSTAWGRSLVEECRRYQELLN